MDIRKISNNLWNRFKVAIGIVILVLIMLILSNVNFIEVNVTYAMLSNAITIIIGSISSIFGIIIAVYILAFSLFEKNYSSISLKLLSSKELSYYFQLCISTIGIMIVSNYLLNENISNVSINLIGLGTTLYILSLIFMYPIIRTLILESKSNDYIDELLAKLNEMTAKEYLSPRDIEDLQQNPFYQLSSLSKNLIIRNEKILLVQILNNCIELIKQNIDRNVNKDTHYSREFIRAFVKLFKVIRKHSEDSNEIWCMNLILETYINIREYSVNNKISHYDFIEYEDFIHDMCVKCIKNSSLEIVNSYIRFLFSFIEYNIENNLPDESELLIFSENIDTIKDYNYAKLGQWEYIHTSILSRIDSINQEAIKLKEFDVVISSFYSYNNLFSELIGTEKLGLKQKISIIRYGSYNLEQCILKIVNKKINEQILITYEPHVISESFSKNKDAFLILFNAYTNIILHQAKQKILSTYELNNYGTLGRSLASYIDQGETIELAIKKIVDIMVTISKYFEVELDLYSMKLYIELYRQAESIIKWCKNSKAKNDKLIVDLENTLKNMDSFNIISEIMHDEKVYHKILLDDLKSI